MLVMSIYVSYKRQRCYFTAIMTFFKIKICIEYMNIFKYLYCFVSVTNWTEAKLTVLASCGHLIYATLRNLLNCLDLLIALLFIMGINDSICRRIYCISNYIKIKFYYSRKLWLMCWLIVCKLLLIHCCILFLFHLLKFAKSTWFVKHTYEALQLNGRMSHC